eukprot:NODE_3374_length_676_cov_113.966507_g2403_i0.p1 GENE.NODE_3374_length_676_cov_113.966507_g2403_i0~~NODE_3374_length_676_cov_113.966507_g2403_i0.p1  ORF type:complete len:87 (-),score=31.55 NODE_3374_length_676_cov_113.966507_g2403_i0:416-652(-)
MGTREVGACEKKGRRERVLECYTVYILSLMCIRDRYIYGKKYAYIKLYKYIHLHIYKYTHRYIYMCNIYIYIYRKIYI